MPPDKQIKQFSKGMKMKLAISVALSHHFKLLILDEATSGLDPVIRDDILDMLLDFVQDEEHSILVSSHITSDLEKIADYIVFIHEGKVVFSKPKDELLEQYGVIKCGAAQFDALDKSDIITYRKMDYEWQILVSERDKMQKKYPKALIVPEAASATPRSSGLRRTGTCISGALLCGICPKSTGVPRIAARYISLRP